ncbi:hypothetical protein SLEP1_g23464 [Rubroshorea leprosula]|uniref:Uncharacterized protein n=1 Tax=Rubroshorea leprosula TaxID=152421 RepID=A0AAV5JFH4_9ROSI|nr:hypothetical protein SLEP1_g23464 [Rubroshorea leprosula]
MSEEFVSCTLPFSHFSSIFNLLFLFLESEFVISNL